VTASLLLLMVCAGPVAHLFPPHLANNQQGGVAHLQSILFPPGSTAGAQSPLMQQVMVLASNNRLSAEQMAQLKVAVSLRSNMASGSF
jgi:hypothetical protein